MSERSAATGYIVIVVSTSIGGWRATWSYAFACLPEPRGQSTLLVTEAEAKREVWSKL